MSPAIVVNPAPAAQRTAWLPTGAFDETFARGRCITTLSLTSGQLMLSGGIRIPSGVTVSTITISASGTGGSGMSNQWFCLVDRSGNVLAKTNDDTSTAWSLNTDKTLTISGGYTPGLAKEVYVGIVVVGTTPTLWRQGATTGNTIGSGAQLGGTSTGSLTNPASLGSSCAVPTTNNGQFYAFIS